MNKIRFMSLSVSFPLHTLRIIILASNLDVDPLKRDALITLSVLYLDFLPYTHIANYHMVEHKISIQSVYRGTLQRDNHMFVGRVFICF